MTMLKDSKSFFEIVQSMESIEHEIQESGGEINEEVEKQLSIVETMLKEKTKGIVEFLNMSDIYFDTLSDKIKELQEKKKIETKKVENFKNHIVHVMNAKDIKKLETDDKLTTITLRKLTMKVVVRDEDKIPSDFITSETVVTNKISLKDIKPHLINGDVVPGAELVKGKQSLIVKTKSIKG